MRVSQDSGVPINIGNPADEDEEFKLAESLAASFSLTQDSNNDLNKRELNVAL